YVAVSRGARDTFLGDRTPVALGYEMPPVEAKGLLNPHRGDEAMGIRQERLGPGVGSWLRESPDGSTTWWRKRSMRRIWTPAGRSAQCAGSGRLRGALQPRGKRGSARRLRRHGCQG